MTKSANADKMRGMPVTRRLFFTVERHYISPQTNSVGTKNC